MAGYDQQRFEVDGVVYHSLDEVPEPHRSRFAEMLRADAATEFGDAEVSTTSMHVSSHEITVNGVSYDSIDDLPPDLRTQVGRFLADHDGDGRPDLFDAPAPPGAHTPARDGTTPPPAPVRSTDASTPIIRRAGTSSRTKLIAAAIVADVVALGVVLWYIAR